MDNFKWFIALLFTIAGTMAANLRTGFLPAPDTQVLQWYGREEHPWANHIQAEITALSVSIVADVEVAADYEICVCNLRKEFSRFSHQIFN